MTNFQRPTGDKNPNAKARRSDISRRRSLTAIAGVLGTSIMMSGSARAQSFPAKSIRLILPFPPGGSTDVAGRLVAEEMTKSLGQAVFIDNKPGAAGAMGINLVAKSAADGYTLGFSGSGTTVILDLVGQPLGYKPDKDLTLIGSINTIEYLMVARNDFPATNAAGLIDHAKANPGKVSYASAGIAGPAHLSWEFFSNLAGITMVHVPYKGDIPGLTDMMSGVVDVGIVSVPGASALVKSGKVKALGLCGATKVKALPDVPLISQSGLPGFESFTWTLLVGPANMPASVVARLNDALNMALGTQRLRDRFDDLGMAAVSGTPRDSEVFVAKEIAKWSKIVSIPGIKLKE